MTRTASDYEILTISVRTLTDQLQYAQKMARRYRNSRKAILFCAALGWITAGLGWLRPWRWF